jgi:WD40 repeat protein
VRALAVLEGGRRALSGSDDCTLRLWDLETVKCLAIFPCDAPVWSIAYQAQSFCVIAGLADGSVLFFHLEGLAG